MIKKQLDSTKEYLITPSLLNSWAYIYECAKNVRESENDEISIEDKQADAMKKAYEDFLKSLNREKSEPNEYMLEGIRFEEECYKGNTCISPIIEGGAYQIVGTKRIEVEGMHFLMYGRLDVLKGGVIYDIKRVWKYARPKYQWSTQHEFYMELFPQVKQFIYLIYDGYKLHTEQYFSDACRETKDEIKNFIKFLKEKNLLEIYKEKWESLK